MKEEKQGETRDTNSHKDNAGQKTDELPPFDPFQTFIFQNIAKSVSPQDLNIFLCPDVNRRQYVTVHMPCDKLGNTKGVAVVSAPKTYAKNIMEFNGTSSKSQRSKKLVVTKEDFPKHLKATKWVKTEDGSVHSCLEKTGVYKVTAETEIKLINCLVDSGAYLCDSKFTSKQDVDKVIERAFLSGVEKIVIKTQKVKTALKAQKLAASYPGILYFTAGVDPSEGASWHGKTTLSRLREILADPQCVALGEIGLDETENSKCNTKTQIDIFTAQVSLACEMGKPLVIREQNMTDKALDILDKFKPSLPRVLISTNNQVLKTVQRYHKKGFFIAVTGFQWVMTRGDSFATTTNWIKDWSENLNNMQVVLASDSPHQYPTFISRFVDSARSYFRVVKTSTCMNLTDYYSSLSRKYASSRNESLVLHSVIELASGELVTTSASLAAVTRKNAYKFFNFSELDKGLFQVQDEYLSEIPEQHVNTKIVPKSTSNDHVNSKRPKRTNYMSYHMICFIGAMPLLLLLLYAIVLKTDTILLRSMRTLF